MKNTQLRLINGLLFSTKDAAEALDLELASAKVACHRYARNGILIRLKKDLYMLEENWRTADVLQMYRIANRLQVPSYISLMTALAFYEITSQVQQGFTESVAVMRSKRIEIKDQVFRFTKLNPGLYGDFVKQKDFFIATPEKAFLDALYLTSINRYRLNTENLDIKKLDRQRLTILAKKFPQKTKELLKKVV